VRSRLGAARTILLSHFISARPSKQPLMVRTFLKVHMELGSFFLFLQEQIKDIIIIIYIHKYIHIYIHVCVCACVCVCVCVCVHIMMWIYNIQTHFIHIYSHACVCVHARVHISLRQDDE
jgi:hypothetical protein